MDKKIEITFLKQIFLPYTELNVLQRNLKDLPKANFNSFKKQILKEGFCEPVTAWLNPKDKKYYILNGTQRWRLLSIMVGKEGYTIDDIPVNLISANTLKSAQRKILALASQYGVTTKQGLYEFASEAGIKFDEMEDTFRFPEFTMEEFKSEFFEDPTDESEDDIPNVDTSKPAITKPGDLWLLGEHRLLCGDCTVKENIDNLMGGQLLDMTFTSPPYNAAKNSHLNGRVDGFENKYSQNSDCLSDEEYLALLYESTKICISKTEYVFVNLQLLAHNKRVLIEYQYSLREKIKDILVWNKSQCPPNIVKGAFNTKWEYLFCFSKNNKTRGFPCEWRGKYPNVIETESNSGNAEAETHRAGFPVSFPVWIIEKMPFETVYDPFLGTGSTLIACEKTNRKCYGLEIDPHYCDVIVKRWQEYTGNEATLDG